jgi:hypothetical protein
MKLKVVNLEHLWGGVLGQHLKVIVAFRSAERDRHKFSVFEANEVSGGIETKRR